MKLLKSRKNLIYAGLVAILSAILAVSSTYAWLGVSRVPYVSDVGVSVIMENALLIAPDENGKPGEEWSSLYDASELLKDMAPLRPVTYTRSGFKKMQYSYTGRASNVVDLPEKNVNVKGKLDEIGEDPLTWNDFGNMIRIDFWMRCPAADAKVCLTEAGETADGQMGPGTYVVGAPVWNSKKISHDNGGHGTETALRLGFKCTPADLEGNLRTGEERFVIYEPNCDIHYDGSREYIPTPSVDGGNLIDDAHIFTQTASSWSEQDPVYKDAVVYSAGKFNKQAYLFDLDENTIEKVSLYIWIEGQDYDCIAAAVADEVNVLIQLHFGSDQGEKQTGITRGNDISHDRDYNITRN